MAKILTQEKIYKKEKKNLQNLEKKGCDAEPYLSTSLWQQSQKRLWRLWIMDCLFACCWALLRTPPSLSSAGSHWLTRGKSNKFWKKNAIIKSVFNLLFNLLGCTTGVTDPSKPLFWCVSWAPTLEWQKECGQFISINEGSGADPNPSSDVGTVLEKSQKLLLNFNV